MRFILSGLGNWHGSWSIIEEAVLLADQVGFWGVVLPDHYMWGASRGGDSTLESWVTLTFLAARTEKLKLGTLVTPIPFRPPAMLAKMVSTVDILSKGRALLGVGAGWSQTEFEGYSNWDEAKVRVDKTEEGLRLILRLWQENKVDFEGKYFHAKGAILEPKPFQKPHPPLLFGGVGRRMLRMAGRHADICYIPPWVEKPFGKAKQIVLGGARKSGRKNRPDFAIGSLRAPEKLDFRDVEKSVANAAREECLYYLAPFRHENLSENIKLFAKEIIPSYAGLS